MDCAVFLEDQYCENKLIHKKNKNYEIFSSDNKNIYIKREGCPKGHNWCTSFPKDCENELFKIVTI